MFTKRTGVSSFSLCDRATGEFWQLMKLDIEATKESGLQCYM